MFKKLIKAEVKAEIDLRTVRPDKKLTLTGYQPLPEIMGQLFDWLFIPFQGEGVLVEIRYCNRSLLPDVDKLYALLDMQEKDKSFKFKREFLIDILNVQERCCRATLNRPTFDELEKAIHGRDRVFENDKKHIEKMREALASVTGSEKRRLQNEIDNMELFTGYVLPEDTMRALTNIALGVGKSDIKKITKEKLIAAYSKARLYNCKPSDFIAHFGLFTDGDRENIDDYATMLGGEEELKRNKNRGN